jgi:hypothetical protein
MDGIPLVIPHFITLVLHFLQAAAGTMAGMDNMNSHQASKGSHIRRNRS